MRARSRPEIASTREAFALLGLHGPVDAEALNHAFRAAVKRARPDVDGGDADRYRRLIAAWRLIQAEGAARLALPAPLVRPPAPPVVSVSPHIALRGGAVEVRLGARRLRLQVPMGVRSGDHLRLRDAGAAGDDLFLPVLVRPGGGLTLAGDDLYMTWAVDRRVLQDGGRIEIATHAGPRTAWVVRDMDQPIRLRLRGLGLPARGARKAGHLFIRLDAVAGCPSAADDLLDRFARVWTPERRLAA